MCLWIAALILSAWAYDRNMLIKLYAGCWSKINKAAWFSLKAYSSWKHSNEMIKDGYHVMKVFLWKHSSTEGGPGTERSSGIDVLRFFREEIANENITHIKGVDIHKFIERCFNQCVEEGIAFPKADPTAQYELQVNYVFDRQDYMIVYDSEDNVDVRFPVYTESTVHARDVSKDGLLSAMVTATADSDDGMDVYKEMMLLAGPMRNFYADSEFNVKKRHLHYTGFRVPLDDAFVKMLDFEARQHIVAPDQDIIELA